MSQTAHARAERAAWLALLLLAALAGLVLGGLPGCAPSRQWCERNYGPCGYASTAETLVYRDTTLYLPGAAVADTICLTDTLLLPGHVRVLTDTTGRARLTWYLTQNRLLAARCQALPDTVVLTKTERILVRDKVLPPQSKPGKGGAAAWALAGIAAGLLLAAAGWLLARRLLG